MLDATPANLTDHVWTIDELLRFTPRRICYFVLLPCENCDVYNLRDSGEERKVGFIRTRAIMTPDGRIRGK